MFTNGIVTIITDVEESRKTTTCVCHIRDEAIRIIKTQITRTFVRNSGSGDGYRVRIRSIDSDKSVGVGTESWSVMVQVLQDRIHLC